MSRTVFNTSIHPKPMTSTKPASLSLTIQASTIGAFVSLALFVAGLVGIPVLESDVLELVTLCGGLITGVTSVLAIIGRFRATTTIE